MWPFPRKQQPQSRINSVSDALGELKRINAIVSEQLGIGLQGQDPLENITVLDRAIFGADARLQYRGLDIVQRIIDEPCKAALKNGYQVKTNYDEYGIGNLIEEKINKLKANKKLLQFMIDTRRYSRGGLMYPVILESGMLPNRAHLKKPLYLENIEKIENLNVIREELHYYQIQNYDPLARDFEGFEFVNVGGQDMDESRIYLHVESLDPIRQRGISTLERILIACQGLNVAEWTITNLLLRYRTLLLKYDATELNKIKAGVQDGQYTALQRLINNIKMTFTSKSVVSVPSTYEFEYLTTTFEGMDKATSFLFEYLSSVSHVPQSIIKGSAAGELAAADADERKYHEWVKSYLQEGLLNDLLQYLCPMIIHEQTGEVYSVCKQYAINPKDIKVTIEFAPLQSVNPMTDAQVKNLNMQTGVLAIQNNIATPQQIARKEYPEDNDFTEMDERKKFTPENDPLGLFSRAKENFPNIFENIKNRLKNAA